MLSSQYRGLRDLGVGYVLALKPSHEWWHPVRAIGSFQEAAQAGRWKHSERPGKWIKVTRTFRDGSSQYWWALEVVTGPNGPHKPERVVIATTDPLTLPDLTTFYLITNLPAPDSPRAAESALAVASLQEPEGSSSAAGAGEKNQRGARRATPAVLAQGPASGARRA